MESLPANLVYRPDLGIAFNTGTGVEHKLDDMGQLMVDALAKGETIEGLAGRIAAEYEVEVGAVRGDIRGLLETLSADAPSSDEEGIVELFKGAEISDESVAFPVSLELELTRRCNWGCTFCYNTWRDQKKRAGESPDIPLSSVQRMQKEAHENGLFRMRYSGGEPLMHPQIDEIIESGARNGLYQVVFTNGSFLTEDRAKHFADNNVREVLLSMHGTPETHNRLVGRKDGYSKVCRGIEVALKNGIAVVTEMTLTAKNLPEATGVIDQLKGLGVSQFRVMRYVPTGRDDVRHKVKCDDFKTALRVLKSPGMKVGAPCSQKHCFSEEPNPVLTAEGVSPETEFLYPHCSAGTRWMAVSYLGEAKMCPHSTRTFGKVEEGIKGIWEERIRPFAIDGIRKNIGERCQKCILKHACKGGCHLNVQ